MKKNLLSLVILIIASSSLVVGQTRLDKYKAELIENGKYLGIAPVDENGKIVYIGVVELDSLGKKDDLYDRGKRFFVDMYKSANDVIQLDDKAGYEIVGKGFLKEMWASGFGGYQEVNVYHTIKLSFKDGKYRYEIRDFNLKYFIKSSTYVTGGWQESALEDFGIGRKKNAEKFLIKVNADVNDIISKLKEAMTKKIDSKNDW